MMYYTYVTFTKTCIIACERHRAAAAQRGWSFLESRFEEQWACYFCCNEDSEDEA